MHKWNWKQINEWACYLKCVHSWFRWCSGVHEKNQNVCSTKFIFDANNSILLNANTSSFVMNNIWQVFASCCYPSHARWVGHIGKKVQHIASPNKKDNDLQTQWPIIRYYIVPITSWNVCYNHSLQFAKQVHIIRYTAWSILE
jgi:hypothetical protein